TWIEEIASSELVNHVKELIKESNVHRLIIRKSDKETLMEIPLTASVAVGYTLTIFTPRASSSFFAMAALFTKVNVEIVRTKDYDDN
ncbi:DUF4342 domain-containing protein, partial [bacterium]|nr:DUF4342 domain-containing protein [bacterium]